MDNLDWLKEAERAAAAGRSAGARPFAGRRAEAGGALTLEEVAALVREPVPAAGLFDAAHRIREENFGRAVGLFAPLYYSNVCANDCVYCGFRSSLGAARRRTLTPAETTAEASVLLDQGHRRILLIASEDPGSRGLALAEAAIEAVRVAAEARGVEASIALELAPRTRRDFARLHAAGACSYILFQETYDRRTYARVHPRGPKTDFENRLDGPLRAAEGGIFHLGLGVLYGVGDPVFETVALVAHARELRRMTGRPAGSVSVPRCEPADGVPFTLDLPHPVGDDLWLRIVATLRLALPETDLIISTRESAPLRRASLRCGATVFSAGSRTDPGGYRAPGEARGQFHLGDERPLDEVWKDLTALGYEPFTCPPPGIIRCGEAAAFEERK